MADTPNDPSSPAGFMQKLQNYVMEEIFKKGLPYVLIVFQAWYFYNENGRLQDKIDVCVDSRILMMETYQARILEALENNTRALQSHREQ